MHNESEVAVAQIEQFKRDRWPYIVGHLGATGAVIGVAWPIADHRGLLWFGVIHHLATWILALSFFVPLRAGRESRIPLATYAGNAIANATLSSAVLFDLTAARDLDFTLTAGIVLFAGAAGSFVTLGVHSTMLRVALASLLLPYAIALFVLGHVAVALGVLFFFGNVVVAGVWKISSGQRELVSMRITESRRAELAERDAETDALTGLVNRRGIERLDGMTLSAGAAAIYFDVNQFKEINDTFGHSVGDEVLRIVAQRLRGAVPAEDVVARLGGDEFLVVALVDEAGAIDAIVERLCQRLQQPIDVSGGHVLELTAAIGKSYSQSPVLKLEDLLRDSDRDMYRSKGSMTKDPAPVT